MKAVLKLPKLSMNMDTGTLAAWYRRPGEAFAPGERLYAVETEKVTADVEAPCAGIVLEHLASEGDELEIGAPVLRIEIAG